nr:nucleotide exchange factor GrpE [uncultured Tessaracoccus sp.]
MGEGVEEPLAPAEPPSDVDSAGEAPPPDAADVETDAAPEQEAETAAEPETDFEALARERTEDLQRLQAEYANYKKRVDRDRHLAKQAGVEAVVMDLLPTLDAIALAKQHDDIAEGGQMIIAEIEKVAAKHGLVVFGAVGEEFDPVRHEALMQAPLDEPVDVVTISQVIQPGYELGGRVIRPARVAVANP